MPLSPAAIGIVLNSTKDRVLLVKRRDVPVWVLPGGGIEQNETAEAAVIREVEEETCLKVHVIRSCADYYPINKLAAPTTVFLCSFLEGTPKPTEETSEVCFYPLTALPQTLFFVHRSWIEDALSSTYVRKPLSQVTYRALIFYMLRHPWLTFRYAWTRLTKQ